MAPVSSFRGGAEAQLQYSSWKIEPTTRPAVVFLLRVVKLCGPAMSEIIKVILIFFQRGEEVAIERHDT